MLKSRSTGRCGSRPWCRSAAAMLVCPAGPFLPYSGRPPRTPANTPQSPRSTAHSPTPAPDQRLCLAAAPFRRIRFPPFEGVAEAGDLVAPGGHGQALLRVGGGEGGGAGAHLFDRPQLRGRHQVGADRGGDQDQREADREFAPQVGHRGVAVGVEAGGGDAHRSGQGPGGGVIDEQHAAPRRVPTGRARVRRTVPGSRRRVARRRRGPVRRCPHFPPASSGSAVAAIGRRSASR